ncbi:MAG: hypothetical protein DI586_01050 [Micavibrio aeruginosavorus]|uniref:Type II toxin-antitoxin system PemK/MazF family toxin n=1 Tax=Micavibrio aeruginosavorus TaxID=349221 RepID=A0A2W5HU98_9BACT|nr:MAG: hypothetical protein DI586_01050 [Micavibrio aeruginosavorus]
MPIREHPDKGMILNCDFNVGFKVPEMVKERLVVVLSPKINARPNLSTVVALSTTAPEKTMPYHAQLDIRPRLPKGLESDGVWIKGDMVYAVGFHRLNLVRLGTQNGKRSYYYHTLSDEQMELVHCCVLRAMGLSKLTKHL